MYINLFPIVNKVHEGINQGNELQKMKNEHPQQLYKKSAVFKETYFIVEFFDV